MINSDQLNTRHHLPDYSPMPTVKVTLSTLSLRTPQFLAELVGLQLMMVASLIVLLVRTGSHEANS